MFNHVWNTVPYCVNFKNIPNGCCCVVVQCPTQESNHFPQIQCSRRGEMKTGPGRKRRKRERQKVTENRAELTWRKKKKKRSCRYGRDQSQKKRCWCREESAERMREEEKDSSSGQGIASVQFEVKFNLSSVSHGMLTSHLQWIKSLLMVWVVTAKGCNFSSHEERSFS